MANTQYSGGRYSESGNRQKRARREGAPRPSRKNDASRTGELNNTGSKRSQRAYTSDRTSSSYRYETKRRGHKRHQPAHAAKHVKQKQGFPVWGILVILLFVIALGAGGVFLVMNILHPYEGAKVEDGQQVTVVIPEGSSGATIIQELLDAGVIHSSKDFRKAVQQQNADQSLRCGTYTFVTGSDPSDVVAQLVQGPNSSEGQLQVPEGLTLKKTAKLVEESLGIPAKDFIKQAKAKNYVDDYPFLELAAKNKGTLEGYLYPKTYDLSGKEITSDTVIRLMLSQFQSEVADLDFSEAKSNISAKYDLKVNDYDILKIASIIEKEAINEDDRPKVSSVFYNRLSIGKALESDATMGYVTGGAVDADDLKTDSPYNTYLYQGLPPTPICSPSQWAIEAAVDPADTDYYYFFIIEEGDYSNHTFSETFEEHDKAYAEALAEMAGDTSTKED